MASAHRAATTGSKGALAAAAAAGAAAAVPTKPPFLHTDGKLSGGPLGAPNGGSETAKASKAIMPFKCRCMQTAAAYRKIPEYGFAQERMPQETNTYSL